MIVNLLKVLSSKFEKKIEKIQKEVFKISKKEFNIASPKQLGEILYNDLKIADLKKLRKEVLLQVHQFWKILLLKDINFHS